jgi:antitoxin (DNA-binding transcriptional repressor) of toxin-antitoxin stability system
MLYCDNKNQFVLKEETMRFVSVRDIRLKGRQLWRELEKEKELVITLNGRPVALLTEVNDQNFEKTLRDLRRTRALRALDEMQRSAVQAGLDKITDQEIHEVIQEARSSRRR